MIRLPMLPKIPQLQALRPIPLMQIHQHRLLQLRLPIRHSDRIIMPVQSMDESLDGRLVDVPDVRCGLARFLAHDDAVRVDEAEGVDDYFAFDGLDGVDDYCYGAGLEGFEGLRGEG